MAAAVRASLPYFAVSFLVGSLLSIAMITQNWGSLGWTGALEMAAVMFWVSFVFNAVLTVPIVLTWPILVMLRRPIFCGQWKVYFSAALLALNVVWILWNRLAMTHQWASVRPFMTFSGLVQSLLLVAILVLLIAVPFLRIFGATRRATALSAVVAVLATAVLVWNGREERRERRYSLERIALAAGVQSSADHVDQPGCTGDKVIVLGLDGLSWNVVVPLMEAGALPTLSALIRQGAFAYLDNGDDSLSPVVWTSIFTGRTAAAHGIDGYRKLNLPVSQRSVLDLLMIRPTIDSFYGLTHLLRRLPSAGLWNFSHAGSNDRKAAALWEIASFFDRTVVVVNPLMNLPVKPINGAAIDFRRTKDPSIATSYPAELREKWKMRPIPLATGGTDASYDRLVDRFLPGVDITFELARDYDPELLIYYTHFPDTVSHTNWDFHARDRFFIGDLPINLTDAGWEALLRDNIGDRLFRAYLLTDAVVGRFVATYPEATFVIVSDHGWTFSGYEHFGSPDGVFIISGPCARNGLGLSKVSVLDVTPTILTALRLPLSRELEGVSLNEAWRDERLTTMIDRYPKPAGDGTVEVELGEEEVERLRALGYLD